MEKGPHQLNTNDTIKMLDYKLRESDNTVLTYNGPLEYKVLYIMGNYIRQLGGNGAISKKLFSIFMELAQNIAYYSADSIRVNSDQDMGVGLIMLQKFDDHYLLTTGNKLKKPQLKKLQERLRQINASDHHKLRELKRNQRKEPSTTRTGGGNIGLIKVALASTKPIELKSYEMDENYSFISIAVKVPIQ